MSAAISERALALIEGFEVSNEAVYARGECRPSWPGSASGVTIGIGYDLGYSTEARFRADWEDRLPAAVCARLAAVCGQRGAQARQASLALQDIAVPYDAAIATFRSTSMPSFTNQVLRALPNAADLHPDSLGALVSLAYNRGCSFNAPGDRYREMRDIAEAVHTRQWRQVPVALRAMKRLWQDSAGKPLPNCAGLLIRREQEAALFDDGLSEALEQPAEIAH